MGKLAVVPTPIGNLEDITLRAIRYLKEADLIFAEDTRTSSKLLKHLNIQTPLKAMHMHNEHTSKAFFASLIHQNSLSCLISDAGTPGISDPGQLLIQECIQQSIEVEVLPGPTAFVPALVLSGVNTSQFHFHGFMPHKKGRQTLITSLKEENIPHIFYESPHRLIKLLQQVIEFLGPERKVAVVRELTKIHEECVRGTANEVLESFQNRTVKGEIVVIIDASSAS